MGSEYDRKGRRKATLEVAGIASQRLRHIEVLLLHPWPIGLEFDGFAATIRIANPVSFIAQKVLIHENRGREDRAKDILYRHDTFEVFGARLPELHELWHHVVVPHLHVRDAKKVCHAGEAIFGSINDDIRRAAQIQAARGLTPRSVREACQFGFAAVFGEMGR